jgi:hypothetical protein
MPCPPVVYCNHAIGLAQENFRSIWIYPSGLSTGFCGHQKIRAEQEQSFRRQGPRNGMAMALENRSSFTLGIYQVENLSIPDARLAEHVST